MIETFNLHRLLRYEIRYNIPLGQKILTVVKLDNESFKAVYLHWGLIPHWSKDRKISHNLINARAETLAEKPAYTKRCCIIPAMGFYEWQKINQGKQDYYYISHQDQQLIGFAGLWEYWEHDTETVYSCTIITTVANELMQPIHHRMPVIIDNSNISHWLGKNSPLKTTQKILENDAYQGFELRKVSDWVNNPRYNDRNCLN